MKPTITIIIPAYNEEKHLSSVIKKAKAAINGLISDYEILIFNDKSTDKTGLIANELAKNDEKIKVIHNPKNRGLGYNYKEGIRLASKEYVTWLPGDDAVLLEDIKKLIKNIGKADIIIPYHNPEIRSIFRRIISRTFVKLMNIITGLNLKYYNGTVLYKTELIKNIKVTTQSYAFQAEILSKLLNLGYSFIEIGLKLQDRGKDTKLFKLKNLAGVLRTILYLFWDIKIKNRKLYNKKPIRIGGVKKLKK